MGNRVSMPLTDGHLRRIEDLYPVLDYSMLDPVVRIQAKTQGRVARLFGWFFNTLPQWLEQDGFEFRGCSFRQSQTEWLLVVRVTIDNIPRVGFVSGSNPTHCIELFQKFLKRDAEVFYVDKYG